MSVYDKALALLMARGNWMHLSRLGFAEEDLHSFREYVVSRSGGLLDVLWDRQQVMVVAKIGRLSPAEVRRILGLRDIDALMLAVIVLYELKGEVVYIPDFLFFLKKNGINASRSSIERLAQMGLVFVEEDMVRTTPYAKRILSADSLKRIFSELGWDVPVDILVAGGEGDETEETGAE